MYEWSEILSRIYGNDANLLARQETRISQLLHQFAERWGRGPVWLVRAPGRVNLIGEHTDYNHGYVLPMAIDKDVIIALRPRNDRLVRVVNAEAHFGERSFTISRDIPALPLGDWGNYLQGPAQFLARHFDRDLHGFDAIIDGSPGLGVPRGAGLSSSSALTVAAAVALVQVNRVPLSGAALADACGQAEWYVGTRGGVMDQFASLLSRQGHTLFLDCRPTSEGAYRYRHVPLPADHRIVVLDSQVRHDNTTSHFNQRVAEGRLGVRLLQKQYPQITHLRDVQDVPWPELEPLLPESIAREELDDLGIASHSILDDGRGTQTSFYRVRSRCRHVYSENQRVLATIQALEKGDLARVGELLLAAHRSAAEDYEISTPELDLLVEQAMMSGAIGARLTGAGWGGCIIALVPTNRVRDFVERISASYRQQSRRQVDAFVCCSAQGAGLMMTLSA